LRELRRYGRVQKPLLPVDLDGFKVRCAASDGYEAGENLVQHPGDKTNLSKFAEISNPERCWVVLNDLEHGGNHRARPVDRLCLELHVHLDQIASS
jgi:hypothetical protein